MDEPDGFVLRISFGKDTLFLPVSPTTSIEILRAQVFDLTKVAPDRQKLNAAGGKKIAEEAANGTSHTLNAEVLSKGVYLLQVNTLEGLVSRKLIIE